MAQQSIRIKPGAEVDLSEFDPAWTCGLKDKAAGEAELQANVQRIADKQYPLWAENTRAVLVVLQGMDTSGKDGVVRHVFSGVNPTGVRVTSFKKPSDIELDHDFLWRIHMAVPVKGEIGVFNRSHYEDVLITRVHGLVDKEECKKRFEQINTFEKILTDGGTTILKFFLHISKDEQKERLEERLKDPKKNWKFNPGDLDERKYWKDYIKAYEDVLVRCSRDYAPWHIIPSDKKWVRNTIVSRIVAETLEEMAPKWPRVKIDLKKVKIPD